MIIKKIETLKSELIANSEDAAKAEADLDRLLSLQKQADVEAVELIVPCADVLETLDFEAYTLKKTNHGYLFSTRAGLHTFVPFAARSTAEMMQSVFTLNSVDDVEGLKPEDKDLFTSAVAYIFQAPIFASMSLDALYGIATAIVSHFNEYCETYVNAAQLSEETEEDVKDNTDFKDFTDAVEAVSKDIKQMPSND